MVLTNQLIYLVNFKTMRKIFFKSCVLLKKSELYRRSSNNHEKKTVYNVGLGSDPPKGKASSHPRLILT